MTDDRDPAPGRRSARLARAVLPAAAVLAAAAVLTVVVSDDVRWLRLGVVAALWAALVAVWALVRRPADTGSREALQARYELELGAEVDARRAHEMTVERDVRRELEAERGDEIDALRAEIGRLRAALEQRGVPSPAYGTRLRVVGGSAAPDPRRDEAQSGSVADLRTTAIPSAAPSHRGSGPAARSAPSPVPRPAPAPDTAGGPAAERGAGVSGRTVAELLAAHAGSGWSDASGGAAAVGGRRRRDR